MEKKPYRKTDRKNRFVHRPKKTTGNVTVTLSDAQGFGEPLSRYVDLPREQLKRLYNVLNGKRPDSDYPIDRLTVLIHEAAEYTASRKLLTRPDWQKRHGINHQAIYRKTLGTGLQLLKYGLRDLTSIQWINNTQLMNVGDDPTIEPDLHDQQVVMIGSSIEIEARLHRGFFTHIDVLENASTAAQETESPLSVPVPKIEFQFPNAKEKEALKNIHFKSDNLFGLPVPDGGKFLWHEHDRHTEVMMPTHGLSRVSWLKKILMMNAIASGQLPIYESYFGIPNLRLFATFHGAVRQNTFNQLVRQYARHPNMFISAVVPPVDFIANPSPLPELYNEPVIMRHDGTMFSFREEVEKEWNSTTRSLVSST
ncbi:hypothetical protein [Bradyrhizobium elkanii]|uniref:hypothetical protein n=1 Tax=Bradyrhizobium elkanii TaxID=29448 RepID=UPI003D1A51FB